MSELASKVLRFFVRLTRSEVTVVAGGQLVQQALALVTGVIIGRMIGAAGYGLVNIVRNILNPLLILAPLGLNLALLKYIGRDDRDIESINRILRRLRLIVLAVNLPFALVVGLGVGRILMHNVYRYPHFDVMLLITLMALPFAADIAVLGAYYRSRGRVTAFAIITLYLQSIARLALVGLAFLFARNVAAIICISTLQVALSTLALWISFGRWRKLDGRSPHSPPSEAVRLDEWRTVRRTLGESVWMSLNMFAYGMTRFVDVFVLGAVAAASVVGSYTALSSVASLVAIWPNAASQTLGPSISRHYHAGDFAALRKVLNDYIHISSIMSSFLFAGVAAFGDHLDLLFGRSFHFHPLIAFLMPLGHLISATLGPTGYSLSMTGHHRAELAILIGGGAALWALCYVLIPPYGDVGAATAVCLSFILINLIRFLWVGRSLGFIPGRLADLAPPFLATLIGFGIRLSVLVHLPRTLPALMLGCALYTVAYAAVAYKFLLGEAGRAKVDALSGLRGTA